MGNRYIQGMEYTKKLQKAEKINMSLTGKVISQSESYEYLSITINKCLTMNGHLAKTHKKAMSRTKLLAHKRHNASPCIAETIYKVMILPQMLYCSNIMLGIPLKQYSILIVIHSSSKDQNHLTSCLMY